MPLNEEKNAGLLEHFHESWANPFLRAIIRILLIVVVLFLHNTQPVSACFGNAYEDSHLLYFALLAVGLVFLLVWMLPRWYIQNQCRSKTNQDSAAGTREISATSLKDRLDLEIKLRDVIVKAVGTLLLLIGVYSGWQQFRQEQLVEQKMFFEKQLAEQYATALDFISDEKSMEKRVAGIYLLVQLSEKGPEEYYWKMIDHCVQLLEIRAKTEDSCIDRQLLNKYLNDVRSAAGDEAMLVQAQTKARIANVKQDVQAAIQALGRRDSRYDNITLPRYWKEYYRVAGSDIKDSRLWLNCKSLNLRFISAIAADFRGANFMGARLGGASFVGANLSNVYFVDAELRGTDFYLANLVDANLMSADLEEAIFFGADMQGAKLLDAKNLNWEQLDEAKNLKDSMLPDYLFQTPEGYHKAVEAGVCLERKDYPAPGETYKAPPVPEGYDEYAAGIQDPATQER